MNPLALDSELDGSVVTQLRTTPAWEADIRLKISPDAAASLNIAKPQVV
jgi:hypothetical protein